MKGLANTIGSILFPSNCLGCGRPGDWVCNSCRRTYLTRSLPECFWCRKTSNSHRTHTECLDHTPIRQAIVCWRYTPLARRIMSSYKFKMRYSIAEDIIDWAAPSIELLKSEPAILIPSPTSKKRSLDRGFDQSELLCRIIEEKHSIPYEHLLERRPGSSHQTGKDREQRLKLGQHAFQIKNPGHNIPTDTNIIIVDDVCTTGTTLQRSAETLQEVGFTNILAFVLFRGKPIYARETQKRSDPTSCT